MLRVFKKVLELKSDAKLNILGMVKKEFHYILADQLAISNSVIFHGNTVGEA